MRNFTIKQYPGFTLIELLVASSLFVLVVGIGMSMWGSITRIQQANLNSQRVFSESRFWLDRIFSDVQSGQIFYDDDPYSSFYPYPKPINPQTELHIAVKDGKRIRYYIDSVSGALYKEIVGIEAPVMLSSPEIKITRFAVYITPVTESATKVPLVTILWSAQDLKISDPQTINIQMSVSLRNY